LQAIPKEEEKKSRVTRVVRKLKEKKKVDASALNNSPKKMVKKVSPEIMLQEQFEKLKRHDRIEIPTEQIDSEVASRYTAFARKYINQPSSGRPIDIVIGFDMGTSSSKILARLPFEKGNKIAAFPVPSVMRADKHANLWKTIIYIDPVSGKFSLFPKPDYEAIIDIKTTLMHQRRDDDVLFSGSKFQCTAAEVATAYIALMLRFVGGWALSDAFNRDISNPVWTLNLGLPAAKMDEPSLVDTYRRIQKIAWNISLDYNEISVEVIQRTFSEYDNITYSESRSAALSIVPEVIAEANGVVNSRHFERGSYLIVDVGASTLDVCLFNTHADDNGDHKFEIYQADVKLFGVLAQYWLSDVNGTKEQLCKAVRASVGNVIIETKQRRDPHSKIWEKKSPVILCGGGNKTKLYIEALNNLHKALKNAFSNFNGFEKIELNAPEELLRKDAVQEFHRLAVAWGLSDPDCGSIVFQLPKEIADIEGREIKDFSNNYTGAEQV
jgi:hypothetical protein